MATQTQPTQSLLTKPASTTEGVSSPQRLRKTPYHRRENLQALVFRNFRPKDIVPSPDPNSTNVPGSGTSVNGLKGPDILGWRKSANPPGTSMLVLTIDSSPEATIVRKLLPFPTLSPVKM